MVGHVEWVEFATVERIPRAGEVVHAREPFAEPAGGGAVAAVALARLAGEALLVTALGEDEPGRRSVARLEELGVRVVTAWRQGPTRRAVTLVDGHGERTITTFGERLDPRGEEDLPWEDLGEMDGVYFTAGDLGALRAAREARVLVASPRARRALGHGVELDALVLSGEDSEERGEAARVGREAAVTIETEGSRGGSYGTRAGESGRWTASEPPGPPVDSYGCGDSFAAGLTYGLVRGLGLAGAIELGARGGAECAAMRGPYGGGAGRSAL